MTNELQTVTATPIVVRSEVESLFRLGMEKGLTTEAIDRLYEMWKEERAANAARAWAEAMAQCKAAMEPVKRTHKNEFFKVTRNGISQASTYAALSDITAAIDPVAPKFGLSYRWTDEVIDEKGTMRIACVVSHVGGHSVSTPASGPASSKAGCSELQKWGACSTYLQRRSLAAAFGLSSIEDDTDGNEPETATTAAPTVAANRISETQYGAMTYRLDKYGDDKEKLTAYLVSRFKVGSLADLTPVQYATAMRLLDERDAKTVKP